MLLFSVILLIMFSESLPSAWPVNLAYVDLIRAIVESDIGATTRFERWAFGFEPGDRLYEIASYGIAMLTTNAKKDLPEDWLWTWRNRGSFQVEALRNQMVLYSFAITYTPQSVLRMLEKLGTPADAEWLLYAGLARPEQAAVITEFIEDKGWIPFLDQDERIRLAAIYGQLAWQKRRSGGTGEEILSLANKALALNPQDELGMLQKAVAIYYGQKQYQSGRELITQAVRIYPRSANVWEVLGGMELVEKHFPAAESAAQRAVELGPTGYRHWLLASALYSQKRCVEALPHAQLAYAMWGSDHPMYLLLLGDVYWCLGNEEQASQIYQRLETVAPNYAPYVHDRISPP